MVETSSTGKYTSLHFSISLRRARKNEERRYENDDRLKFSNNGSCELPGDNYIGDPRRSARLTNDYVVKIFRLKDYTIYDFYLNCGEDRPRIGSIMIKKDSSFELKSCQQEDLIEPSVNLGLVEILNILSPPQKEENQSTVNNEPLATA